MPVCVWISQRLPRRFPGAVHSEKAAGHLQWCRMQWCRMHHRCSRCIDFRSRCEQHNTNTLVTLLPMYRPLSPSPLPASLRSLDAGPERRGGGAGLLPLLQVPKIISYRGPAPSLPFNFVSKCSIKDAMRRS